MHFTTSFVATLSALAAVASATNFTVIVGKDSTNSFEPTNLTGVKAGDTVSFQFVSKNHSLTQSTFAEPCVAKAGGVNSGFAPVAAGVTSFPQWAIQIDNVTAPLWFFCAQVGHCKSGMVFAINPTADKTFDSFLTAAKASTSGTGTNGTSTPGGSGTTGSGAPAASDKPASGAFSVSAKQASTFLAAVGIFAALTL